MELCIAKNKRRNLPNAIMELSKSPAEEQGKSLACVKTLMLTGAQHFTNS